MILMHRVYLKVQKIKTTNFSKLLRVKMYIDNQKTRHHNIKHYIFFTRLIIKYIINLIKIILKFKILMFKQKNKILFLKNNKIRNHKTNKNIMI